MAALPGAVVFDNDGLLHDTEDAWTRAETRLFARYGRTFTMDDKRRLIGTSHLIAAGHLEAMLGQPGEGQALLDELYLLVMEEGAAGVAPRPGAVELVEALLRTGVPIAVASNSVRDFVDLVLAKSPLAGCFDAVIAGDEVPAPKPAPDIYLEACRRLGAEPSDTVALEDSPTGIASARAAGLRVVGVPYLPDLPLDADLVAASLGDRVVHTYLGLF